jgi:hypothetical protein
MQPQTRRVTNVPGVGQPIQTNTPGETGRVPVTQRPLVTFPGEVIFDQSGSAPGTDKTYTVDISGLLNRRCDGFHLYSLNNGDVGAKMFYSLNGGGWRQFVGLNMSDNAEMDLRGCEIQDMRIRLVGVVKAWIDLYGY